MASDWPEENVAWLKDRTGLPLTRMLELLADGQWHIKKEIVDEAIKVVPPGVAIRMANIKRYHTARASARRSMTAEEFAAWEDRFPTSKHYLPQRTDSLDENQSIRTGARTIVLDHLSKSRRIEQKVINGVPMVRRVAPVSGFQGGRGRKGGGAAPTAE